MININQTMKNETIKFLKKIKNYLAMLLLDFLVKILQKTLAYRYLFKKMRNKYIRTRK